jgi:virulence-associated protein VagC
VADPKDPREGLRAKIFRTGRSRAVRLPKEVRFEADQAEVRVRREGNRVILDRKASEIEEAIRCELQIEAA